MLGNGQGDRQGDRFAPPPPAGRGINVSVNQGKMMATASQVAHVLNPFIIM